MIEIVILAIVMRILFFNLSSFAMLHLRLCCTYLLVSVRHSFRGTDELCRITVMQKIKTNSPVKFDLCFTDLYVAIAW